MALYSLGLTPSQTSRCSGPVTLPPDSITSLEVLKLIAHRLRDNRQALHACLLVSRAWSKAAVEYLYKAQHMMDYRRPNSFSTSSALSLSLEGLSLEEGNQGEECRRSTMLEPIDPVLSVAMTQQLLKQTLEASLLHDDTCSYDYISYLNKISCPWLTELIQDWEAFCAAWKDQHSGTDLWDGSEAQVEMVKTDPSVVLQEYCFNQLVRRVAERCTFVDGYQSSAMILPDTHVYAIRHLKHLTRIDLKYSQDLNDNVFHALAETVHSLSYLRLPGSEMEDVSAQAVADMIMSLQKNTLQQFKIIYGTNIFKDNSVLKAIGQRHGGSMQRLTLAICDLENAGLQEYGPLCTKLVSLNLEYSSGVTDDVVLPILDGCPQLEKLDLTETDCTHATIHGLSTASDSTKPHSGRFAAMKRLVLNNIDSPFTTNLFLPLADACPMLEELHMNSILADSFQDFALFISKTKHLRDLDIGNAFPEFTDDNLISLVDALPNLRWLSIANAQITNASVVYLGEKAHSLCDLCILGCDQVTKTGLIEFLDKMSNKAGFKHLDITYCRLDDGAVVEIRERAKAMAIGHGLVEVVEVEGDDQFSDSLLEEDGERDDGEEADDDDDETEEDSDGEDRDSATELEEEDDDEY